METITVNVTGKTRRATMGGRAYVVAPLSLIVPGVLNGNRGPGYYPLEEIERHPAAWNGMPIVVNHPYRQGRAVSARSPEVLDKSGVGFVFNTRVKGKLAAEGWFDEEATLRIDPRIYGALEASVPIELSTGLDMDREPAEFGSVYNGSTYEWVARNFRPDHLAVLPDDVGACSLAHGCGVLVNSAAACCEECVMTVANAQGMDLADMSFGDRDDTIRMAFYEANPEKYDEDTGVRLSCYVIAVHEGYLIYSKDGELYRQSYSVSNGKVTFAEDAEAVRREVNYVPIEE
jgi:hypothetical protein